VTTLYFEDLTPGRVFDLGSIEVTADEIIDFATRFDPQPFHVDPQAGAASHFGGLVASGWHTCALFMRLLVDGMVSQTTSMGSPGMDEVRWTAPVRPGDTLTGTFTIDEARASASKPDRGIIRSICEMRNQDGTVVLTMRGMGMYGRRPE
jgi:acyl dehydratase